MSSVCTSDSLVRAGLGRANAQPPSLFVIADSSTADRALVGICGPDIIVERGDPARPTGVSKPA